MSRFVAIGLTALILTACGPADQTTTAEPAAPEPAPAAAATASTPTPMPGSEGDPADALQALESRAATCLHYMGEHSGMGSERDHWLNDQMDKYRCGELAAEARAMRDARSGEPAAVARLDIVLAEFE